MSRIIVVGTALVINFADGFNVQNSNSPLLAAAEGGHSEVVDLLLQAGADLNGNNSTGYTPLCAAAHNGHVPVVQKLLEAKAEIEKPTFRGDTPLILAAGKGHSEVVKILLGAGAIVNPSGLTNSTTSSTKNNSTTTNVTNVNESLENLQKNSTYFLENPAHDRRLKVCYSYRYSDMDSRGLERNLLAFDLIPNNTNTGTQRLDRMLSENGFTHRLKYRTLLAGVVGSPMVTNNITTLLSTKSNTSDTTNNSTTSAVAVDSDCGILFQGAPSSVRLEARAVQHMKLWMKLSDKDSYLSALYQFILRDVTDNTTTSSNTTTTGSASQKKTLLKQALRQQDLFTERTRDFLPESYALYHPEHRKQFFNDVDCSGTNEHWIFKGSGEFNTGISVPTDYETMRETYQTDWENYKCTGISILKRPKSEQQNKENDLVIWNKRRNVVVQRMIKPVLYISGLFGRDPKTTPPQKVHQIRYYILHLCKNKMSRFMLFNEPVLTIREQQGTAKDELHGKCNIAYQSCNATSTGADHPYCSIFGSQNVVYRREVRHLDDPTISWAQEYLLDQAVRIVEQTVSHLVYYQEQTDLEGSGVQGFTCEPENSYNVFAYDFIPNSRWELFSLLDISYGPITPERFNIWKHLLPEIFDYYGMGEDLENPELNQCSASFTPLRRYPGEVFDHEGF